MMSADPELNRVICLNTEIASFFIFHPDDLQHRFHAPHNWSSSGFACRKEFDEGRLVTWSTGGDGGTSMRVTTGKLTQRELQWLLKSWDFRLRVRHGRVLLDGGDCLPADEYWDTPKDDHPGWIDLPNGDYRVTVHDINWYDEPGATDFHGRPREGALPDYVIEFTPVENIETIRVASNTAPTLCCTPDRDYTKYADENKDRILYQEERTPLEPGRLVLLVTPNWLVLPGCRGKEYISKQFYEQCVGKKHEGLPQLVLTSAAKIGQLAMLCQVTSAGYGFDKPWRITFRSRRLVRIVEYKHQRASWVSRLFRTAAPQVRVEPVERTFVEAPPEELELLQARFANYAANHPRYRAEVKHAEYEAESLAWLKTTEGITNRLLDLLQVPLPQKLEIFLLPPPSRVAPLLAILEQAGY